MKSRYIKRRKKFHYIIISVTIIVCLLGTVLTSLAILDSSRDLLIANAVNELNTKMDYIKNGIVTSPNNSYNEYVALINENVDKGNTYFQLTYDNDMTITTDNVLTVHYNDINGGILDMGTENYIRFDVLKNLLSDDEYKEICNYLNTPADKDGNYYLLICKKFYGSAKYGYVPSQLEIVKSNKENDWYVQDESIKKYSFDLKKYNYLTKEELKSQQFENDEMHRNIIDKDFFLGKSKPKYSQKDVEKILSDILSDNSLFTDIYDETGAVPDGIFKYYVLMGDSLYYTENHMINNSPNEYKEVTRVFHITSLKEINLLDDCLWKFITVFAVAFTIMAVVITVEIFSWKDFKRRTAQEETRLEMTNAIAHNLKTPLFVIGGFAENLKNEEDTEKKLHNIEIIQQQTEEKFMKRVLSLAIVLMLAFSCVFTAFAQTDDTATPDEAKKVTELKITKLPDKLTYTAEDVIEPDIDLSKIADENATEESLIKYFSQFNLELKLDLTGMEIEAVYSDGTTEKVDAKDCKAELADPFNYGEVIKALIEYEKNMPEFTEDMTEDEFYELLEKALKVLVDMIYREYTVNVSYQDAQTSYKITLENSDDPFNPDLPDDNDRYEVVSVKAPEKVNYTKADIVDLADYDYDDEPIYGFTPDYKGMEVVVKDIVTGKTYTIKFDGTEDIYVDDVCVDFPDDKDQKFKVGCQIDVNELLGLDEDEEYMTDVDFSFVVKYNVSKSAVTSSTKDTATKDTVTKSATGGNGAVQTGNPMTAVSVALVMLVASGAMFVCYRRKIEK